VRPSKFSPAASRNCVTVILVRLSCPLGRQYQVNHSRAGVWVCTCVVTGARWPMFCRSSRCTRHVPAKCKTDCVLATTRRATQSQRAGRVATGFQVDVEMGLRILFTAETRTISIDPAADPRLLRVPVQPQAIPRIRSAKILALSCPQRSENSIFMPYNELR
jgi:hypothetical protein